MVANLALQVMVQEVLSLPDNLDRRIWLFLDEFGSLGNNVSLLEALSVGRSKGLCSVVGIQDIGKIEYFYGRVLAKSIINTFSTSIFLRATDPDTAKWTSNILGEQEVKEPTSSTESSIKQGGKSNKQESKTESVRHKQAFLPSEISNFEDLTGVLKVPGWPIAKLKWQVSKIPNSEPVIVDADWVNVLPHVDEEHYDSERNTKATESEDSVESKINTDNDWSM